MKKNGSDNDRETTVTYYDDVLVNDVYSETISIHWRQPQTADGRFVFDPVKIAPAKLAVAMAKAETLVPTIPKDTLLIQNLK